MDKNIEEREKLLDTLSSEYEQWISERLDNSDELLTSIRDSLAPDGEIVNTLKEIAGKNNTFVSDEITTSVKDGANTSINNYLGEIIKLLGGDSSFLGNVGDKGYAKGTTSATKGLHWFNEKGNEIIIRKKDGAMLGNFDQGDVVISNEGAKLLSAFSQNPTGFLEKFGLNYQPQIKLPTPNFSTLERRNISSPSINLGGVNIVCNEVNNPQQIANEIIHNKTIERAVLTMVDSAMMGKNSLSKLRF